jgi:hypothetical protein
MRPAGHEHVPAWQVRPPVHALPHIPQLLLSVWTSRQVGVPPTSHSSRGATQVERHAPAMQAWPAGHALPHIPQLLLSVCVSMHDCAPMTVQRVWPAGHIGGWQVDATHESPAAQAFPQAPQCAVLVVVLTHVIAAPEGVQSISPAGHTRAATHAPAAQRWLAIHALLHAPQLLMSVCVLTQPPPHAVSPAMHMTCGAHTPARQTSLAAQARSQAPQCAGLVCVSVQPPPQKFSPTAHIGPESTGTPVSGASASGRDIVSIPVTSGRMPVSATASRPVPLSVGCTGVEQAAIPADATSASSERCRFIKCASFVRTIVIEHPANFALFERVAWCRRAP